jgi:subtilisin family serine protease
VDTGLNLSDPRFKGLICDKGSKNFVEDEGINDFNGHGTFVAGLIRQYAGKSNYCLLIYKYFRNSDPGTTQLTNELSAFNEAILNKADIINLSAGGIVFNEDEYLMIKYHPEITFVVSAGNDSHNLDIPGNEYYPASYWLPNEKIVENVDKYYRHVLSSNYSKRSIKELGDNVLSDLPNGKVGYKTGSSMSTAITTGKLIRSRSKDRTLRK